MRSLTKCRSNLASYRRQGQKCNCNHVKVTSWTGPNLPCLVMTLPDMSAFQWTQHVPRNKRRSVLSHVEETFLCCTLATLTSRLVPVQRSHADLQGTRSCCWDSKVHCMTQQKHNRQCVSRQWACHTAGPAGKQQVSKQCQSCTFVLGYICSQQYSCSVSP